MRHHWKTRFTGLMAAILAASMPLQSMGAVTGLHASALYSQAAAQGTQQSADEAQLSALILQALQKTPDFDAAFYADTYPDVTAVYGRNAAALENHYRTFGIYEGRMANSADLMAWKIRVMRRIKRFLDHNSSYYLAHFNEADFPWFHADTYLQKYADAADEIKAGFAAQGITPTADQLREGAVRHYLEKGALQGKRSCSAFDPVWAIVADPDIAPADRGSLTPGEAAEAYTSRIGKADTADLNVGTREGILQLVTGAQSGPASTASSGSGSGGSGGSSRGSGSGGSSEGSDDDSGSDTPVPPAKKDQTFDFLAYICGSDLETNSAEGSSALMQIMYGMSRITDAEAKRLNCLICAGGSKGWHNAYMRQYLNDGGKNTAVYTLNRDEVVKRFNALKSGSADLSIPTATQKALFNVHQEAGSQSSFPIDIELLHCAPDGGIVKKEQYTELLDYLVNADTLPLNKDQLSTGAESISESPVFSSFLSIAKKEPADQYGLFIWNHGGGIVNGICTDDVSGGGLYAEEIRSALEKQNMKLSVFGLDACLMGSVEFAYYLKDHCDYIVASPETSFGNFAYHEIIPAIANNLDKPETLGKEAVQAAVNYNSQTHRGLGNAMETSTAIDVAKAEAAASALNDLAQAMYDFAGSGTGSAKTDHTNLIYDAWLQARLRAYSYGAEADRDGNSDYVDAGLFLTRLREELGYKKDYYKKDSAAQAFLTELLSREGKGGALLKAEQAVKEMTISQVAVINDNFEYSSGVFKDGKELPAKNTMSELYSKYSPSGTSLYIPYYSSSNLKNYYDTKLNPWNEKMNLLFAANSGYRKLMEGYLDFIALNEDGRGQEEKTRISNLKKELMAGRRLKLDAAGKPMQDEDGYDLFVEGDAGQIIGYDDILSIGWQTIGSGKKYDILSIGINPDAYVDKETSKFSSGDPFVDLADTAETMKIYVTRQIEAVKKDSGDDSSDDDSSGKTAAKTAGSSSGKTVMLDIVIGEHSISYGSIDGVDSAVKVFSSTLQDVTVNMIEGASTVKDEKGEYNLEYFDQLVIPYHEVTDYDDKVDAVNTALGLAPDKNRKYDGYYIFRGSVVLEDKAAKVPKDVCLIFGTNSKGGIEYLAAAERFEKTGKVPDDESIFDYRKIDGVEEISFSEVFVDKDSEGGTTLRYVDDYYDISRTVPTFVIDKDNPISLTITTMADKENPGSEKQNRYFFGLAPKAGINDVYVLEKPALDEEGSKPGEIVKKAPEAEPVEGEANTAEEDAQADENETDAGTGAKTSSAPKSISAKEVTADEKTETAEEAAADEKAETAEEVTADEKAESAEEVTADEKAATAEEAAADEKTEAAEEPAADEKAATAEEPAAEDQKDSVSAADDHIESETETKTETGETETKTEAAETPDSGEAAAEKQDDASGQEAAEQKEASEQEETPEQENASEQENTPEQENK